MVLGVRPEDVHVEPQVVSQFPETQVTAIVRLIEPMGHENMVYLDIGSQSVIARADNAWRGTIGDSIRCAVDPNRIHAFDPSTEQSLM